MRCRFVVLGLLCAVVVASTAKADRWDRSVAAARAYAAAREGRVAFALIAPHGRLRGSQAHSAWYSASLLKPVIMGTLLTRANVRRRALTSGERALLRPMIRRSANEPASRLFVSLGPRTIERFGRRHGLRGLRVAGPIWGSSVITAAGYAHFLSALPEAIPRRHRWFARHLLETIVPSQRWGVGAVRPPGWTVLFKGGWRAGRGYGRIVNQAARLECGPARLTLTVLTDHDPSHAYGTRTVRGVARRLLRPLPPCDTSASTSPRSSAG